ncbi:MAG: hypothetical protein ABSB34_05000 [Candidatus Limnocylindrales bacterium]
MSGWPEVELGKILRAARRLEVPAPNRSYRQLGVRLWGEGAYERPELEGGSTHYPTLNRVAADDMVVNKIWARNGSVAVVPPALDGCYVSTEFPLFTVDRTLAEPAWIGWLTRWPEFWHRCDLAARGTSGKNRIRPERLLAIPIPLPLLDDQRRLISSLDELEGVEALVLNRLRRGAELASDLWAALGSQQVVAPQIGVEPGAAARLLREQASAVVISMDDRRYNSAHPEAPVIQSDGPSQLPKAWCWTDLGSAATHIIDCVNDTPDFVDSDTGYVGLKSTNVRPFELDMSARWYVSEHDYRQWNRRVTPSAGDILLTREAPMGYACLLPENVKACLTQRLVLIRVDRRFVLPEYVLFYLNGPLFRSQVTKAQRGLTSQHIRVGDLPRFVFPMAPMADQKRTVETLSRLKRMLDGAAALRDRTREGMESLASVFLEGCMTAL